MERLYYEYPYVKTFEALVTECRPGKGDRYEVILDRTGFYPEGGGQPGDTGRLGSVNVLDVHEREGDVVHETDGPLLKGLAVTGTIDWERRFGLMQNHSGEHLLSGLVHKRYGYDNVGFHMGKSEVTVDFNGVITAEQLKELEWEVNRLISLNLPVLETYPSPKQLSDLNYRSKRELTGRVRIIEIPGGDVCACCGTHVAATGEIGILKITGMIHYKGGVRMSLLCGMAALEDYERKQEWVSELSVLLSEKPHKVVEAVSKLKMEGGLKEMKINRLYQELFASKLKNLEKREEPLLLFEPGLEPTQLRQYATLLYESERGSAVLVCSGEDGHYQYAAGSATRDMRRFSKYLNDRLNGRGGGSALLSQGSVAATNQEIAEAFAAWGGESGWS